MKTYLLTLLYFAAGSLVNAEDNNTKKNEDMNTYKKTVTLWYEAFTKKDPALLEQILHDDWVDIPSPPGTAPGPEGFPSKNRKMDIQVVDIHEFKDGRIIRTWHTEDWMSGLRQLGVFER